MKGRTRLLAWAALGGAALWVLALVVRGFVFAPAGAIDAQVEAVRAKLEQAAKDRQEFLRDEAWLRQVGGRTFGQTPDTAAAEVGAMLTGHILRVGLREADFSRIPIGERRLRGAVEIGWTVQGEGPLARIVDLLYLLERDPRLHRIEGLVLSPSAKGGRVRVRFRFLTLLLTPAPPPGEPVELPQPSLDAPERRWYAAITRRDLLRPYVPRRERERSGGEPAPPTSEPPAAPDRYLDPASLKIVSLSSWGQGPEIHVRDERENRIRVLHPGDTLGSWRLVTVDYRPLPHPAKPVLLSYSRLILRQDDQWYAVECGQTLADRRPISTNEFPFLTQFE